MATAASSTAGSRRSCPDVPASFLDPRATWADPEAYDTAATRLAGMFAVNFRAYEDGVTPDVQEAGPRLPEGWEPPADLDVGGALAG